MRATGEVMPWVGLAVVLSVSPAPAQDDRAAATQQRMAPFEALVGEWRGEGWIIGREGRSEFASREIVESRLDGLVLLVEGLHESKTEPGKITHHAFGMLSWDAHGQTYRFRTQVADGRAGDYEAEFLDDGRWRWAMEVPSFGMMRYTIRFENDRWEEIGEHSRDGESWRQFFEMKLDRVR